MSETITRECVRRYHYELMEVCVLDFYGPNVKGGRRRPPYRGRDFLLKDPSKLCSQLKHAYFKPTNTHLPGTYLLENKTNHCEQKKTLITNGNASKRAPLVNQQTVASEI